MKFDIRYSMFDVRRKLRWLVILLAGVTLSHIALAPSSTAYGQSDAEHQQFLFAYKLLQRGDLAEAAGEFDRYLGRFPRGDKLGDAQYYRALLHRKDGKNEEAAKLLEGAADPTLVPGYAVDLLRGQVLSDLGRYREALGALERIQTDQLKPAVAVSAHYLKGLAYRGADNLEAAATALAEAAKLDTPMKPRALLDLAKVQALLKETDTAIQTLDQCLTLNSPDTQPEAARFAGDLSYNQANYDKAIEYYGTVVSRFQSSNHFAPAVVGTLWAQFGQKKYKELLTTFDRFSQALPLQDRLAAWYLAGSAYQELGEHAKTVALLSQVSRGDGTLPIQEKILYKLAVSQYELKERDAMDRSVAELSRRFPASPLKVDLAFLQASSDADRGEVSRGAARLTEFVDAGPQSPYYQQALLRRANLFETHKELAAAARDYRLYLASVNQPSEVSMQATFRLMELAGALGKHEEVKTLALQTLATQNKELLGPEAEQEAMYRLAVAHRYLGDLDAALATHDRLADQHPLNPYRAESGLERGLIRVRLGDYELGLPLLEQAAEQDTLAKSSRVSAMRIVAREAEEQGNTDRALAYRQMMEGLADRKVFTAEEALWLGRTLLEQGKTDQALSYLSLIEDGPQRDQASYLTGKAQRLAGKYEEALETLGEVRALSPRYALPAWLDYALTLRDQGKLTQAAAELKGLINTDQDQQIAAEALYEAGRIHRSLAAQARQRNQDDVVAEQSREARRVLKMVILLHADRAGENLAQRSYLELAELAHTTGNDAEEIELLKELTSAYPDSVYSTYATGVLSLRAEKRELAQRYLRQTIEQSESQELKARAEAMLREMN